MKQGVLFARGRRILFADADGASRFSDLSSLMTAMDSLVSESTSSKQTNHNTNGGHTRRKSLDGMFGKAASGEALKGHGLVAGSRAHLEKSEAVVQVSIVFVEGYTEAE